EEFVRLHGGHAKFLAGESEIRSFLARMIDRRLLVQEAYRVGLDDLPQIRDACRDFAEDKAVEALLRTEIDRRAEVSEAEIRLAWERHTSDLYEVRQIVLPGREAAEDAFQQILAGADFERLASS